MTDYKRVADALDEGVEPEMICQTCPWDRLCINPPSMSRSEVKAKLAPPPKVEGVDGQDGFVGALVNIMAFAGKDQSAPICPVLAVRLGSSDGKHIADVIRGLMTTNTEVSS